MQKFGLLLTVLLLAGCTQSCQCPNPGTWSECNTEGLKTRVNYECRGDTNYECIAYNETTPCDTSITVSNGDLTMVISPTLDIVVSGTIKLETTSLPEATTSIVFMMYPQNEPINMETGLTSNQLFTSDQATPSTGWTKYIDTIGLSDGLYELAVLPTHESAPDGSPWLAVGQTQVIVKNQE